MTRAPAHSCPFAYPDHPNLEGGASLGSWPHPATCTPHAPPRGGARAAKLSADTRALPPTPRLGRCGAAARLQAGLPGGRGRRGRGGPERCRPLGAPLLPTFPGPAALRVSPLCARAGSRKAALAAIASPPHPAPLPPPSPQPLRARGLRASVARPSPLPTAARAPAVPARLPLPPLSGPGRPRNPPGKSEVCATGARKDRVSARAVPFNHVRRTFPVVGSQEGYPVGARFRFVW